MKTIIINQSELKKEDLQEFYDGCTLSIRDRLSRDFYIQKNSNKQVVVDMIIGNDNKYLIVNVSKKDYLLEDFINTANIEIKGDLTLRILLLLKFDININPSFSAVQVFKERGTYFGIDNYIDSCEDAILNASNKIALLSVDIPYYFSHMNECVRNTKRFLSENIDPSIGDFTLSKVMRLLSNRDNHLEYPKLKEYGEVIDKIKGVILLYTFIHKCNKYHSTNSFGKFLSTSSLNSYCDLHILNRIGLVVDSSKSYLVGFSLLNIGIAYHELNIKGNTIGDYLLEDLYDRISYLNPECDDKSVCMSFLYYASSAINSGKDITDLKSIVLKNEDKYLTIEHLNRFSSEYLEGQSVENHHEVTGLLMKELALEFDTNDVTLFFKNSEEVVLRVSNNIHPSEVMKRICESTDKVIEGFVNSFHISNNLYVCTKYPKSLEFSYDRGFIDYLERNTSRKLENVSKDVNKAFISYSIESDLKRYEGIISKNGPELVLSESLKNKIFKDNLK